jgi:DNA-binding transcriptional LysR family regulator
MSTTSLVQRLPRHLKLGELRVYVAVLEHRSFRKAAAALHLTQPAVTKAIASLEATLGFRLFDRIANGVELTVHGAAFAPRAAAVFEELRRAAQELTLIDRGDSGTLRVGIVPMPAIPFLPVALGRLADRHPGMLASVTEARESELLDRLRRRDVEVAILRMALVDPPGDLRVERLFDERLCVVARREHPLAGRADLDWAELLRQRWVMPPADCYFFEHVQRTLDRLGLPMPAHTVEAYSIHIQFGMVLHAGLLSFGMRSQVSFAPGKEFLVRLNVDLPVDGTQVAAVSLMSHEPSPLARMLVAQIRELAVEPAPRSVHAGRARVPHGAG